MSKRKAIQWKGVLIAVCGLALFYCAYVILTLFALPVSPVEYKAPPKLVQQVESSADPIAIGTNEHDLTPAAPTLTSPAAEEVETLAKSVLFNGQSPEQFVALFGHPDPDVRAAAAHALALCWTAHMGMAEPRAEGHDEYMRREYSFRNFWENASGATVLEALLEVMSKSVETGGREFHEDDWQVLYLLSGDWGQSSQRAEILAWVANHHPSDDMRLGAMFFLVNRGEEFPREIGDEVLDSRAHDPSVRVRFEAWRQRMQRIPFG